MYISKTPLRITLFGGGTDYPEFFLRHGGEILSVSINKYSYVLLRELNKIDNFKYRIIYSSSELCNSIDEIKQPVVKAVLNTLKYKKFIEIHYLADLPAFSGLGTSSSFCVGLLNVIQFSNDKKILNNELLAMQAINIERNILNENVGIQDQYTTAIGGLVDLSICTTGSVIVNDSSIYNSKRLNELSNHLLLFFTGKQRYASDILVEQINKTKIGQNDEILLEIKKLVYDARNCLLNEDRNILDLGYLFDYGWRLKKSLSSKVSNIFIDEIYEIGKKNGALGGKIIGAGDGGFILFFAEPKNHLKISQSLEFLTKIDCSFDFSGSEIINLY